MTKKAFKTGRSPKFIGTLRVNMLRKLELRHVALDAEVELKQAVIDKLTRGSH